MDEPSLAFTYSITDEDTFVESNPDVRFNQNDIAVYEPEVIEYDCEIADLCGIVVFGNGFFCKSA